MVQISSTRHLGPWSYLMSEVLKNVGVLLSKNLYTYGSSLFLKLFILNYGYLSFQNYNESKMLKTMLFED